MAPVRPPLHVHFQVVLQVPSHPGEIVGDRDGMVAQVVRGPDAGEHEQLGRMEGAGGENDLSFGTKGLRADIGRTHHAPREAALQQDLPDDGVRADAEIGPRPRGIDERVRGARPFAPVDVPVEGAEPFLVKAVDGRCHESGVLSGSVPRNPAAAIARSGSARIAAASSPVRRFGIVISRHIRDRTRIAQHSAAHMDRRSCPPDAPVTLWTTREMERDRFRSADGRVDRSVMMMAGNSRRTVALTDALDSSPHWGQERSLTSGTRCPLPPCGSLSGSLDPRESGQHRRPPTSGDLRGYPATATLGGSHHRTPGVRIPSLVRLSAPGLEFRCFQMAYGDFRCLDGRMVGVGTRASQDWAIRGRVRRLGRRIPRTGPTGVFTDTAVGQFSLDATNVTSSILLSRELKSPGSVEGPNYVSDSRGRAGKR